MNRNTLGQVHNSRKLIERTSGSKNHRADKKVLCSLKLFSEAQKMLVGGVNSPVRAYAAVGGKPLFISRARGSRIYDADRNEYIDYVCSWGANILGSAHPGVVSALQKAVTLGTSFGASTQVEVELARLIQDALPSMELIRLVNSGTEAAMSAVRVARAYTRRKKILKFEGCYHGHADPFLVKAGSGVATLGLPGSAGVPAGVVQDTIVAPYNNLEKTRSILEKFRNEISSIIVEPVAANMGVVLPGKEFLKGLRELATKYDSVLIFDEVITGFRVGRGGAQTLYNIQPDLTCLGKIIGGGLPVGAYGGREELMRLVAPLGPVYQAGTLSGNPLAMTAGIATLNQLKPAVYERLDHLTIRLATGLLEKAEEERVPVRVNRVSSLFSLFFTNDNVTDYVTASASNRESYARFFWSMNSQGIYLPPSPLEAMFLSAAHSVRDITETVEASTRAFSVVKGSA